MFEKLHAKLGDFWWYSLMLFVACRAADLLNAFVGLWLVPKYVDPSELGAVLPLQNLSGLFAVPLSILATVFAKYINTYATRGEYGKVKSLIIDTILAACALFVLCIIAALITIPHFYIRLNIVPGMLTTLILASGFTTNIANLFTAALQGLKKFRVMSIQSFICAPVRLITMLLTMPFRALSGYILGQATPPAACSMLAAYSLHRDLRNIPIDTSWRKDCPEILRYFFYVAIYASFTTLFSSLQTTVYRQRLPEIESAAYYMLSRLAEITSYFGMSMIAIIFPLASEANENRDARVGILMKAILCTGVITTVMACIFAFFSEKIIMLVDVWRTYVQYAKLLPWLTIISGLGTIILSIVAYESACRRFLVINLTLLINAIWTIILISFTGFHFFDDLLPHQILDFMATCNLANLHNIVFATTFVLSVQLIVSLFVILKRKTHAITNT